MNVCNIKVRLCQLNEDCVENQFNWEFILETYKMVIFLLWRGHMLLDGVWIHTVH